MASKLTGLLPGALAYKYAIDVFSSTHITGWCFHRFHKNKALTLVLSLGEMVLGECTADELREDLKKQSLHPSGLCGFSFVFPKQWNVPNAQLADEVVVSIKDSNATLCVLNKNLADKVAGRPTHLTSKLKQGLSATRSGKDKVFFMHIPKTAGTTFNTFAKSIYPSNRAITHIEFYDPDEYAGIACDHRFISGHLNVGQIQEYFPVNEFKLYTLMREPYAQLHSHFNWLKGIGAEKSSAFYQSQHRSFKEIADDFAGKSQLSHDDLQKISDNLSGVLKLLFDNCQTRYFLSENCEEIEQHHFDRAEQNMAIFEEIGITEEYDKFKASFCKAHDLKVDKSDSAFNASRLNALYDYQDPLNREILLPLVDKDLLLYQQVLNR